MNTRVALYCRVSTKQHQTTDDQEHRLVTWAEGKGHEIQGIYRDHGISGAKAERPGLDALMRAVHDGLVDAVVITKFSRMFRSTKHLLTLVDELQALGVAFISLGEQLDSRTPQGRLFMTMLAAMAEFERDLIRERIRNGLENARRKGVKLGRPSIPASVENRVIHLLGAGVTKAEVGRRTGLARGTIIRIEKEWHSGPAGHHKAVD
jgi:putative DNA-invertase from lambdoid prophage Rac